MEILGWLAISIAVIVCVLAAVEIFLRLIASKLYPLTEWQSWEMHHKVAALDDLTREGGASVVAVGSSMVNAAVDPDRLSERLHRGRPAFNAGLNGAGTRLLELWTLGVVLPRLRPEIVVIGLGSHEVSSGNTIARRLLDSLVTSGAWRDLEGGGVSIRDRLIHWAEKKSLLVRYRRYLGRRRLFRDTPIRRSTTCRRLGKPRALLLFRFRPYRIDERQLVIWNQLLDKFKVGAEEMAALDRIIAGVRAIHAVPIIVRMPVTEDWINMHPRKRADFDQFEHALTSFARERDVPYIDLGSRYFSTEEHADPVHLNGSGLVRFTDALADAIDNIDIPSRN